MSAKCDNDFGIYQFQLSLQIREALNYFIRLRVPVATTTGREITLELAQTALEGQIESSVRHISITDIIDVVTNHFDVRLADLQSKKRSQSITEPRQICMYLARNLTKHSLEEIGGHLGGRDHTTVMHACSKITHAKKSDVKMEAVLEDLTRQITKIGQG
ncbi:MAG: helix-turn-helix domain-containing protein [Planctomycetota bacterium]|jgi:chromosomal replication initiator protein